jgi:hypothetical protein
MASRHLYFMRLHDESQSFHSLGMAMRAMKAAGASELADFLPSLRSVARMAIEELEPEDTAHYALGRMLGATARHMCVMAPGSQFRASYWSSNRWLLPWLKQALESTFARRCER